MAAIDISRLRRGMKVQTADGARLGTIAHVWEGTDPTDSTLPCDEELCSRVEVHAIHQQGGPLYLPYSALTAVSGRAVSLNVDAATVHARNWHHRPSWLPPQSRVGMAVGIVPAGMTQVTVGVPQRRKGE